MTLEHCITWIGADRANGCEMPKMTAGDLKALLAAERYDALSAMAASKLSDERASALNYYMGNMSKDMPAPDGRSKAVSSDVADTIEGLMPPLMDIFASGDEVVQFAPVGPEDVAAAEQETDYVNHVFMQQKSGLSGALLLHQGRAAFESRRGQGVVGVPRGGRARDLSRPARRRVCADRFAAGRGGCGAYGAGSDASACFSVHSRTSGNPGARGSG